MSERPNTRASAEALPPRYIENPSGPSGLAIALGEARRGNAVFPTEPYAKTPWRQSNGYPLRWSEAATADITEIEELGWPTGANVAIACKPSGPSGLLIIDTDDHGGADGIEAYRRLCKEHEPDGDYPDTRIVETPTGGLHHYYRNPGGRFGNSTGALLAGIDVRGGGTGDGGYVLAAGSVLDRRAYEGKPHLQELVGDGKAYLVYNAAPVLDPPGWLLEELLHQKPRRKRTNGEACHALLREWPSVTLARLNAELSKVAQTSPGAPRPGREADKAGRNNQLHESACRFGEAVAVGRVDEETARAELRAAAEMCGLVADDGDYRVEATIDSGLTKGATDLIGGTDAHPLTTSTVPRSRRRCSPTPAWRPSSPTRSRTSICSSTGWAGTDGLASAGRTARTRRSAR